MAETLKKWVITRKKTLVFFQGLNVNMYMTFPLAALESVELIRGPGSVLYGFNAFTGVVNLKPRIPEKNEFSVSSMMGSYGYYESDVTAGGKSGEFGYITAFRLAGQDVLLWIEDKLLSANYDLSVSFSYSPNKQQQPQCPAYISQI